MATTVAEEERPRAPEEDWWPQCREGVLAGPIKDVQNWAGPELGLGRDLNARPAMGPGWGWGGALRLEEKSDGRGSQLHLPDWC